MITPDVVVCRTLEVRVRRIGDSQLVARDDTVMELNETGVLVWKLADGVRSVRDISARVEAEYDVTLDEAYADTLAFVTEMVEARLMKVVE